MKPRNPMGIHVHKRKAGAHKKTGKAARRQEKMEMQRRVAQLVEQEAFNLKVASSRLAASTTNCKRMVTGPAPSGLARWPLKAISVASRL